VARLPEPGGGDRAPDVAAEEQLQPDRAQRHHVEVDLEQGAEPACLQLPALGEGDVEPVEQDPDREAGVQQRLVGELQELIGGDEAGQPLSGRRLGERDPRAQPRGKPRQGVDVQGGLEGLRVHEPARVLPGGSNDRPQHDPPTGQEAGIMQGRPHLPGRLALDLVLDEGLADQGQGEQLPDADELGLARGRVGDQVAERRRAARVLGRHQHDPLVQQLVAAVQERCVDGALARPLGAEDDVDVAGEHLAPLVGLDEVRGELVALLLGDSTADGQLLEQVALAHRVPLCRERWCKTYRSTAEPSRHADRPTRSGAAGGRVGPVAFAAMGADDRQAPTDRASALADRLLQDAIGALELYTVYLGERLGLYRALADGGPATSSELAERTGTAERYLREWLEHHASSGLLEVDDPAADPLARRYRLPLEHLPVLADPDDVRYQAHKGVDIVRAGRPLPALVEAFRTGDAPPPPPWEPEGRAEFNRALYLNLLGSRWLPAIPEVDRRLRAEPPARVADVACGTGWSSIAMARAYPAITVDGFDLDPDVIAAAGENAEEAGVADRVRFAAADAADPAQRGRYDLVTIFEALHDMSRPVDALRVTRAMLADGGSVVVADELVGDEFVVPAPARDRYAYGWSVVSCLPSAMGDPQTAATGAVMRPATLRRYAAEAGFGAVEVLPIETDYWRFYRLLP
jgi:2-polyprenyl-3-methyl-5-hydroxy-6-metoxy-1,4-benzoquinol methylase